MIKSIIVPLVKNKCGNLADKNNYRPIALSSISSSVFEHGILFRLEDHLWTNNNQFGFKPSHSTDLCVYALAEFIAYFKSRSTSIYVAFLDAIKAFEDTFNIKMYVRRTRSFFPEQECEPVTVLV